MVTTHATNIYTYDVYIYIHTCAHVFTYIIIYIYACILMYIITHMYRNHVSLQKAAVLGSNDRINHIVVVPILVQEGLIFRS